MDVKSAFLNGFINEEVYVAQPPGFIDFAKPNYVFRLKKALYGLKQAPKAWYDRLKAFLIKHDYSMGMVDNTLFTKKKDSNIIIVQIYVDDIIFGSTCQEMCDDFAKIMHDEFEMSMMGELNFFLVENSTTEAEYVAAANCYGHVLWIQNQMLDYGFNFMNTKIHINNESTICILKNPVFHSTTKHIEIRHHFIIDSYEKKLIQEIKIHTDHNVADLLTKAFDISSGPIHLVADETVYKEWEDRMERAATTASRLEAEQDSGNINRTQSMETLKESLL
ncbi:copia protein [Tanacetum coccineum]|uniref:Copia protein n=1 Tax=Tanacetum coccineum TaxID=301880 RepID=A0ABQ5IW26_9ASTR